MNRQILQVTGSLPVVLRNQGHHYQGDLKHYFRVLFRHATNLYHPYHNLRHMCSVLYLCYEALKFYGHDAIPHPYARALLIAAIFHDFDHTGEAVADEVNIDRAIAALRHHILPEDRPYLDLIESHIRITEYPHKVPHGELSLTQQILRDADMADALSSGWIQHVILGLSKELNIERLEMLGKEEEFLSKLHFNTVWARDRYPQVAIESKQDEVQDLLDILNEP